jgi:hypothetical protein
MPGAAIFGISLPGDGFVQAFHKPAEVPEALSIHSGNRSYGVLFGFAEGFSVAVALYQQGTAKQSSPALYYLIVGPIV